MGGRDGSLAAAVTYSAVVFAGTIPLWLFNSFAAVIRGTGNMFFPAAVVTVGALILIPLSPLLIFGFGPFPQLGIAGGAAAVVLYYSIGSRDLRVLHLVRPRRAEALADPADASPGRRCATSSASALRPRSSASRPTSPSRPRPVSPA